MRKKPYTDIGIKRVPCSRCGNPSSQQWQICSLDNRYAGVCTKCDILLNELVLRFMRVKNVDKIIMPYRAAQSTFLKKLFGVDTKGEKNDH